jgi:hypothetical protein
LDSKNWTKKQLPMPTLASSIRLVDNKWEFELDILSCTTCDVHAIQPPSLLSATWQCRGAWWFSLLTAIKLRILIPNARLISTRSISFCLTERPASNGQQVVLLKVALLKHYVRFFGPGGVSCCSFC